jgi:uncharacterized protein YggU (UPF0235/DUF167 family)
MPRSEPTPAVRVAIRVKPGASRTRVGGTYGGTHGADGAHDEGSALVVAVSERAVDGKATEAALRALAAALGVPGRSIRLVSGAASRAKIVEIHDPPGDLAARLNALRAG